MRRVKMLCALVGFGALSMVGVAYQAPQPPAERTITVDKVKDNLWVLKGGGGNTAVFATANGIVVVDAKNPGWGQPILDAAFCCARSRFPIPIGSSSCRKPTVPATAFRCRG